MRNALPNKLQSEVSDSEGDNRGTVLRDSVCVRIAAELSWRGESGGGGDTHHLRCCGQLVLLLDN